MMEVSDQGGGDSGSNEVIDDLDMGAPDDEMVDDASEGRD